MEGGREGEGGEEGRGEEGEGERGEGEREGGREKEERKGGGKGGVIYLSSLCRYVEYLYVSAI